MACTLIRNVLDTLPNESIELGQLHEFGTGNSSTRLNSYFSRLNHYRLEWKQNK